MHLDPAQFTTKIDNPWWPMTPGSRWVFREITGPGEAERVEITVTNRTKKIMGIDARVVHDVLTLNGEVQEDTYDMRAKVPSGTYDHLLTTRDGTRLEPNLIEHKFYARGVGPVLSITVSGGSGREELLSFQR